jgi:hypothetical protein
MKAMSDISNKAEAHEGKAWWHYGHAWLVFGGPAAVVVACMITVYIAVSRQDPVVEQDYYRKGIEINQTLKEAETAAAQNALEPAMRARNHAATGVNQEEK